MYIAPLCDHAYNTTHDRIDVYIVRWYICSMILLFSGVCIPLVNNNFIGDEGSRKSFRGSRNDPRPARTDGLSNGQGTTFNV